MKRFLSIVLIVVSPTYAQVELFIQGSCLGQIANCYDLTQSSQLMSEINAQIKTERLNGLHPIKSLLVQNTETLKKAFKGRALATEYGITQTPAIVFDHKAIVYGTTSIQQAERVYQKWHG